MAIERDPYVFPPASINADMLRARMMGCSIWLTQPDPTTEEPMKAKCKEVTRAVVEGESVSRQIAQIDASAAHENRPGFFVDFTDYEELLEEFNTAALKAGMEPSESALDLIYLFASGELYLKE